MESQLFPVARQLALTTGLDWLNGDMRAVLLPDSYAPTFTEQALIDIPAASRVATSELITPRTAVNGVAGCSVIELGTILSETLCSKAVVYLDTGDESTSTLILFIGDEGLVSSAFTPVGLTYYIYPNVASGGLFKI